MAERKELSLQEESSAFTTDLGASTKEYEHRFHLPLPAAASLYLGQAAEMILEQGR